MVFSPAAVTVFVTVSACATPGTASTASAVAMTTAIARRAPEEDHAVVDAPPSSDAMHLYFAIRRDGRTLPMERIPLASRYSVRTSPSATTGTSGYELAE